AEAHEFAEVTHAIERVGFQTLFVDPLHDLPPVFGTEERKRAAAGAAPLNRTCISDLDSGYSLEIRCQYPFSSPRSFSLLSQTLEYALRAVVHLAAEAPEGRTTRQI